MTGSRYSEERLRMAEELFAIDVDAEIRKLGRRRQKTKGESVVELIQFAASMAPSRIEIDLKRRRLTIRCKGGTFDDRIGSSLATIMSPKATSDERHLAVVSLEDLGGLAMLTAFKSDKCRVALEWTSQSKSYGLLFEHRRAARRYEPNESFDFQIDIKCLRKDYRAEIALVKTNSRFARVPIWLGGKKISGEIQLSNCLVESKIRSNEFEGVIGVPKKGELVNLTTLTNGIVTKQTVLLTGGGIALDAVVEKNRQVDMNRVIDVIEERGKELYSELAVSFESLDEKSRPRVRELLLEYCLETQNENHIRDMKLFEQIGGVALSLDEVKTLAKENRLFLISSDDQTTGYKLESKQILVLGELERRFLEAFLKHIPTSPPPLIHRSGFKLSLVARMHSFFSNILTKLPKKLGRVVPDDELEQSELEFLGSIRKQLSKTGEIRIYFSENQRSPIAEVGGEETETFYVSRDHPKTRQMVTAFLENPLYVFPSLELLGDWACFRRTSTAFCGRNNDA